MTSLGLNRNTTWMSRDGSLGLMGYNPNVFPIYRQVISSIDLITIDPNFQQDIQVGGGFMSFGPLPKDMIHFDEHIFQVGGQITTMKQ